MHAKATRTQLHNTVIYAGDQLSVQGLDKRFTPAAETFLKAMLAEALCLEALPPIAAESLLGHFNGVFIVDSTLSDQGYKLLSCLNLSNRHIQLDIVPPNRHDNAIGLAHQPLPSGSLRLADLGFFDLKAFARYQAEGVFWISRYKANTKLFDAETGQAIDLTTDLPTDQTVYRPVWVGAKKTVKAFLVARPVSPQVTQNRQQRRAYRAKRKHQCLSDKTLALAAWDIYLTTIPDLSVEAICALARARWQVELVFKLWKSFFGLELSQSADPVRQRCLFYARLIALWLTHVLMMLDPGLNRSWWQTAQTIRDHAKEMLKPLRSPRAWRHFLNELAAILPLTSRLSKRRSHPLTFQLLADYP